MYERNVKICMFDGRWNRREKGGVPYKDRIDQFLGELGYDDGSIVKPLQ